MADYDPTPEQRRLLSHDVRRCARVLAGPGTGKSATMVALLQAALERGAANSPRAKLLTFTRAATSELARQVGSEEPHRPSTIHSFAISVLLQNPGTGGFPEPLRIADDWEHRYIVQETLKRRSGYDLKMLARLEAQMAANWESLDPSDDSGVSSEDQARYLGVWQEHRRVYGYTLLAELPFALRRALEAHDDLDGLDFDLLVVDEYQDLNACDLDVLRQVHARRGCAVIAAGDDDQSIYGFRKAHPAGIRRFAEDYPDASSYSLSVPLRCGRKIVEWANHVIAGDPDRPGDRALLSPLESASDGEAAHLNFPGNVSEARGVADLVERLRAVEDVPPSEILVLLRSDYLGNYSSPLRAELEARGIPCSDPGVVDRLFAQPDNRRFLALLRLLANPEDSLAWATLVQLENGLNSAAFLDYVYQRALRGVSFASALLDAHATGYPDAPGQTRARATALVDRVLPWVREHAPSPDVPADGWSAWVATLVEQSPLSPPEADLLALMADVENVAESALGFGQLLSQIQPLGRDLAHSRSEGVRIMTMTASKGLTVQATIIAGLDNVVMPRPDEDQSEARRLLYVAMTRSRDYLYVTWARRRQGPTARAGSESLNRRLPCLFLDGGPVPTQDGDAFLRGRWA